MTRAVYVKPFVQNYAWGTVGSKSEVARLAQDAGFLKIDESAPYAELWMGCHPSGMNQALESGAEPVDKWLDANPSFCESVGGRFPFLMKVLSVAKALSIQLHPNKSTAERLHATNAKLYPDANHKPEVAIPLTEMEALCGFRDISQTHQLLMRIPTLVNAIGADAVQRMKDSLAEDMDAQKDALRAAYSRLFDFDDALTVKLVDDILAIEDPAPEFKLAHRLKEEHGYDVGIFSAFFLNYRTFPAGACLFMPANIPHAYLSGDLMECMACSDNVVRAGLTPKPKDVPTLLDIVDYTFGEPPSVEGVKLDAFTTEFDTQLYPDFAVLDIAVPQGERSSSVWSKKGPSIVLVQSGAGVLVVDGKEFPVARGQVLFVHPNSVVDVVNSDVADLRVFVAKAPERYFETMQ